MPDNWEALFRKNEALEQENQDLNRINKELKKRLSKYEPPDVETKNELFNTAENTDSNIITIDNHSSPDEKIALFYSLFQGRRDVYAKRWESKKGTSGYSPVCLNEWKQGECEKPRIKCSQCSNKDYQAYTTETIKGHLTGSTVVGVYPLLKDERCMFLAMDFDKKDWSEDVAILRDACIEMGVNPLVERSRSGNGAHIWIFFSEPVLAAAARKLGTTIITHAMNKRHDIPFSSYDRLFPNQDIMPKGGLGNLIALPLQKQAREQGNSTFIDENFLEIQDPWKVLDQVEKLSETRVKKIISQYTTGDELGLLREEEVLKEYSKPWLRQKVKLQKKDFPEKIVITKANMLYIPKEDISQKGMNNLQRIGAFKNPEFYKAQPIIFMQCGPILYQDDIKKQADKRPFDHVVIPRFSPARIPSEKDKEEITIQALYALIIEHKARNQLIIQDVLNFWLCLSPGKGLFNSMQAVCTDSLRANRRSESMIM